MTLGIVISSLLSRHILLWVILLAISISLSANARSTALDDAARSYVKLALAIGEHDPGYVDAYYGPPAWMEEVKAQKHTLTSLAHMSAALVSQLKAINPDGLKPIQRRRRLSLLAQLRAARGRLSMLQGKRLPFVEEARVLFGVSMYLKPLSFYDATLARIDRIVPGSGPLPERVNSFLDGFIIPEERITAVIQSAIAECRRRTIRHIRLPRNERFSIEQVTGKSWGAYNHYKGAYRSVIQINRDLPVRIDRAIDFGCHEGYPGHHVLGTLVEQRLVEQRKWIEYSIYPLYSPLSLISEGTANYGIDLAFPGTERTQFEARVLYPLARLNPASAQKVTELLNAMRDLGSARFTIARDYLDGHTTRDEAINLLQNYQLISKEAAKKSISFIEEYRSYVVNYGAGYESVKNFVECYRCSNRDKWQRFEEVIYNLTDYSNDN